MSFTNVMRAIDEIARGRMIILVDDEDRENEGDLCMAAEKITPEAINFMAVHARGLICLTLTEEKIRQLEIPMMVERNTSAFQTGFTVSIEAREGVTTGISAADRAHTIRTTVQPTARPDDLVTPGHVFPIRARNGGVLVRTGQTEGSVDLARLAGLDPSGVICEIMNVDGTMARRPELEAFAAEHGLLIVSIAELVQYRYAHDQLVEKVSERRVRHRRWGDLRVVVTRSRLDGSEQLALVKGDVGGVEPPLVRVQALDTPADLVNLVLGAGGAEFDAAMQAIEREGRGVFVYLPRTSPGARMSDRVARLEAGPGMAPGYHRVGSRLDLREFGTGAQILRMLGVRRFRVLSNHDIRIVGLEGFDLELVERVPLPVEAAFALVDDGRSEA